MSPYKRIIHLIQGNNAFKLIRRLKMCYYHFKQFPHSDKCIEYACLAVNKHTNLKEIIFKSDFKNWSEFLKKQPDLFN